MLNRNLSIRCILVGLIFAVVVNKGSLQAQDVLSQISVKESEHFASTGRFEDALATAEEAVQSDPTDAAALSARAKALSRLGRVEQAIGDFDAAIRLKPSEPNYYYNRGAALLMLRRDGAAADLRAFLRLKGWGGLPEKLPPPSYYQSAAILTHFAYRRSRQEDEARKILDEVVESHWFQPDVWPYSIIRYLRREIDANALFAAASNDQKKMAEVQAYIGLDLLLSNRANDAIPHLRWASVNGPVLTIERDLASSELKRIDNTAGESPISGGPSVVTDRLHVFMIIEDDMPCGPSFEIDAEMLSRLIALQIDRKRLATPVVLRQSKREVTREVILSAAQKLDVRASDAILCFYAGLGIFGQNRDHDLVLPNASSLPRAELLNSLKAKGARLTVLMTDCGLAAMPPGGEILVLNPPGLPSKVLFWLLFGQKGIVDINSSAPGEFAICLEDGGGAQGSIFMRSFVKDCTLGSFAGKRKVPWDDFFGQLKKTVGLTYRMEKNLAARKVRGAFDQPEQNPYAWSIKTEWDVPPSDEKDAPPSLRFPNEMP